MKTNAWSRMLLAAALGSVYYNSFAQVSVGADIASRYIWRGVDYGNSPSFQPGLSYTAGGLTVGTWGAYSFAGTGSVFAEHDLWASLDLETAPGTFSILFTDYYYPSAGLKFFDYGGGGGAHVLEAGLGFAGTEGLPLSFKAYYNFHNDPEESVYFEVAYPFAVDASEITLFAGGSPKKSTWYATHGAALINVGVTVKKSLIVTESFNLPVSGTYIVNPELEQSYLVFGISF